jgi:polyhydroxyalkanoate synthesis regulator phasin
VSDPTTIKNAIATLRANTSTDVQPLAQDLAASFQQSVATQQKIDQATALSSDMRTVAAELSPYKADLDARRARNAALRVQLAHLQARRKS